MYCCPYEHLALESCLVRAYNTYHRILNSSCALCRAQTVDIKQNFCCNCEQCEPDLFIHCRLTKCYFPIIWPQYIYFIICPSYDALCSGVNNYYIYLVSNKDRGVVLLEVYNIINIDQCGHWVFYMMILNRKPRWKLVITRYKNKICYQIFIHNTRCL